MTAKKARSNARSKTGRKSGAKSGALAAPDGTALVPQPHGGAIKEGGDHARPGRPPNAVRQLAAQLLKDKLLPRAVEVIGASTDGDLHLRAIEKFVEVAHNEKMRLAKLAAGGMIASRGNQGAVAAVQVHVSGGPTGVERSATEVHPPT